MKWLLYISTAFFLFSCKYHFHNKENIPYSTKSGLKYIITKKGEGDKAEKGQKLKIDFTAKVKNGEQFASTYERGMPIVFQLGSGQVIAGLDEFFLMSKEGTEATLEIPSQLAYGDKKAGKIPPNATLVYYVKYIEILDPPVPFEVTNQDTLTLESGLKFIKVETTEGKHADAFNTVVVDYTGYLENGNIFDSSVERGFPIEFTLAKSQVIRAWDEGIQQMREGEKYRFIVPPSLAYGEKGFSPVVGPNATLIFDIELLEVK